MRIRLLAVCAGVLLPACLPGAAAAGDAGLFSADVEAPALRRPAPGLLRGGALPRGEARSGASGLASPRLEGRSRVAGVDLGRLSAARSEVARGRPHPIRLNLFADADFEAVFERTAPTASGYTLTGRLADDPLSTVVLAVNGDVVAGTVWGVDGVHTIRGSGGGASVRRLDLSRIDFCGGGVPPSAGRAAPRAPGGVRSAAPAPASSANASAPADDGSVIDLLVAYPSYVRESQGGHRRMRALIDQDVALANEAYRVGGASQRLALVGVAEVDYEPHDPSFGRRGEFWSSEAAYAALFELQDPSDGQLDEVHALRDSRAADLVLLHFADSPDPSNFGFGVAFRLDSLSSEDWRDWGFAASTSFPFTHELGHNMGLMHERADNPGNQPFPYSHGYAFDHPSSAGALLTHGTIMYTGLFMNRFSNPNQRFPDAEGVPLGVPGDAPSDSADGPADAVRSLNGTRRTVANFRAGGARCAYAVSPEAPLLPAAGGVIKVRVEAAPGCRWTAAGGRFATLAQGSKGIGDGEVIYRVPANEHWEREVSVLVAGEVVLTRQAGARPVTPVCERTPAIARTISDLLGKPCAEIAGDDLAGVIFLETGDTRDLEALRPGDFDGLSNLRRLDLGGRQGFIKNVASLPSGVFGGLSNLRELDLGYNRIASLPSGAFEGLPNLELLDLEKVDYFSETSPTIIEPGVFEGLAKLRFLELGRNRLSAIGPGVFEGLASLRFLDLGLNRLSAIGPGVFEGLASLERLDIGGNRLSAIGPGVFEGLASLRFLDLGRNRLSAIGPGVFEGLASLERLDIGGNRLSAIAPEMFEEPPSLKRLQLDSNNLTRVPTEGVGELPNLTSLTLSHNPLGNLAPGVFDNLPNLRQLSLIGIGMDRLAPGVLDRLPLTWLHLAGNQLTTWHGRHVSYSRLAYLMLWDNRIKSLPRGAFEGFTPSEAPGSGFRLHGNPGAPFVFRAELVRLPSSGRSAEIAVEVAQGAPFEMRRIELSASGGALSSSSSRVGAGRLRGDAIRVTPSGGGPVVVSVGRVPGLPYQPSECDRDLSLSPCFNGIRTAAGAPLVLYGFLDQTLAPDGAVRFDLPTAFPNLGEGASYAVKLSNPAAVEATVREGLLIVSATNGGETEVAVTATGPDGRRETRRFAVRALASPEAVGEMPSLSLVAGESVRVEVSARFRDPDGGPLAYAAESADSAVAAASVDGGAVNIAGRAPGVASVTVTATDPDGLSAALTFTVTVEQPVGSLWGGWRSALLRPPPAAGGDGS